MPTEGAHVGLVTSLLGPQRFDPFVASVLDDLHVDVPVAVITAGWQEREDENDELRAHIGRPVDALGLYRRAEQVHRADTELFDALRRRQDRLRDLQQVYRRRLDPVLSSARELVGRQGDPSLLDPERDDSIDAVRRLDTHHVRRIRDVHERFAERWRPHDRESVARHREEIAGRLRSVGALLIAGGHVAVVLNRLRLFGILELAAELPVVAWSAGAMALTDRVVLFHDSPPQGAGNAEILDAGLGRCPGVVVLPDATRRLRLGDPTRVSILARRLMPAVSIAFDAGARIDFAGAAWRPAPATRGLHPTGDVLEVATW